MKFRNVNQILITEQFGLTYYTINERDDEDVEVIIYDDGGIVVALELQHKSVAVAKVLKDGLQRLKTLTDNGKELKELDINFKTGEIKWR